MYIPIPPGINKSGLIVKISVDSLLVQVKGQDPIINGKFYERINSEDSIWTIEDDLNGKVIHLVS